MEKIPDVKQKKITLMFKQKPTHQNSMMRQGPTESEIDVECSNSLSEPNRKQPRLSEQISLDVTSNDTLVINPGLENSEIKSSIPKGLE